MSLRTHLVTDGFFAGARHLRRELEARFDPRRDPFDRTRFVWEPWFEGGFSQLRAPARALFSPELVEAFEARLLSFAAKFLGAGVRLGGPPWLSILTDGHHQSLHRDSPNGALAYSYGVLPRGALRFRGGETEIARPELLDYWGTAGHEDDSASHPLFEVVPPKADRLVVFDARLPHAVRRVEGSTDPRDGRAAIQGWLVPGAFLGDAEASVKKAVAVLPAAPARANGLVTLRVDVGARGAKVRVATALLPDDVADHADVLARRFRVPRGPSRGTFLVPLRIVAKRRPVLA